MTWEFIIGFVLGVLAMGAVAATYKFFVPHVYYRSGELDELSPEALMYIREAALDALTRKAKGMRKKAIDLDREAAALTDALVKELGEDAHGEEA